MAPATRIFTPGRIVSSLFNLLLYPALLFFISGDWRWTEGWIFSIWHIVQSLAMTVYLYRHDPELLIERFRKPGTGGQKNWDKIYFQIMVLAYLAIFVIIPLDAKRLQWTQDFPLWLKILGGLVLLYANYIIVLAAKVNSFASPYVRIDTERKQKVVSTGIYGTIRHPMYLASILLMFGTPLLLGSGYGILFGVVVALLFVGRTIGEESMLMAELEGYAEYTKKVKYRLIPGIW